MGCLEGWEFSNALRVLREIWIGDDEELWSKPWIGFLYEWGAD